MRRAEIQKLSILRRLSKDSQSYHRNGTRFFNRSPPRFLYRSPLDPVEALLQEDEPLVGRHLPRLHHRPPLGHQCRVLLLLELLLGLYRGQGCQDPPLEAPVRAQPALVGVDHAFLRPSFFADFFVNIVGIFFLGSKKVGPGGGGGRREREKKTVLVRP